MEPYAPNSRIQELEECVPSLVGAERMRALAELAWFLRERDTRRARALAIEAASMASGSDADGTRAWIALTLAECALLFREAEAARENADAALAAFASVGDPLGIGLAARVRGRVARLLHEEDLVPADVFALDSAESRARDDPAARCTTAFALAQRQLRDGDFESAAAQLASVSIEALTLGMDELALESELANARILGAFHDVDGALALALPVVEQARARGWRGLLATATASVCEWLIAAGEPGHAMELLVEARASLAAPACGQVEPTLERLMGEAQLALGQADAARQTLHAAEALLRSRERLAEAARVMAVRARAMPAGDVEDALGAASHALRLARESRSREAEMEALATLGRLHAARPGGERTARCAVAFLRHAAEIADELDDCVSRESYLQELAAVHEAAGDLALALAAQKHACAESHRIAARREREQSLASRARRARERETLRHENGAALRDGEHRQAAEARRAHAELDRLRAAAELIAESRDTATLVERLEAEARAVAAAECVALFVLDDGGRNVARHARTSGRAVPVREVAMGDLESYAARAARERRELLVEFESAAQAGATELRDFSSLWFAPVCAGESVLGVLTVQSRRSHAFGERERLVFRALCGHAGAALSRARLEADLRVQRELRIETEERLHRLATSDALTALATRPHFFSLARERLERARRGGGPCGLIIGDVDAFKAINDIHGHAAGDRVLASVAATIAVHLRGDDVAGRIGGEEFTILLPGATLEATVAAAERMRQAIEGHAVVHDGRVAHVTLSFGCTAVADAAADLPDQPVAATLERLMREADGALYEAQGTGGNRTIAWPAYQALRALRSAGPGETLAPGPQSFA
jgi:diguanylate cyclase (GGDEF)-like protein